VDQVQDVIDSLNKIKLLSQHQISAYQSQNDQYIKVIKTLAHGQINDANKNLDLMKSTIQYLAQQQLKLASTQIDGLLRETLLQNPKNVMAKGYGIVRSNGQAIRSIQQISNDSIQVELQDGSIDAKVIKVHSND
jgi:exodeoxyribonuclease VII large subunit